MDSITSPQEAPRHPGPDGLVPAMGSDIPDITRIMQEASDFKQGQGDDLWGTQPFTEEEITRMFATGNLFVYRDKNTIAAAVLLSPEDVRMWGEEAGSDQTAIYIHRLCVADAYRGQVIRQKVMPEIESYALSHRNTKLRLDCPYDNRPLCEYYERLGFHEVRRYDRPQSAGGRNPDKDVYRAGLFEKDLITA